MAMTPAPPPARQLLILDTETSGIDPAEHHVLEIAAILYSVEHRCVLQQISTLIPGDRCDNPAESINRIPIAAVNATPVELAAYLCQTIVYWGQISDYVIAHNAPFDRQWCNGHAIFGPLYDQLWLCTCHDFTWPEQHRPGQKLIDLALAHGIGVSSAHRALTDCQLIAALFDRLGELLPDLIAKAAQPKVLVRADVSFEERQLAKDAGFRWDGKTKQWTLAMVPAELEKLGFRYSILAEELSEDKA
jgi:DNA polymerase III subunit epsilon